MKTQNHKLTLLSISGLFVLCGLYNALVINADSQIKSSQFEKHLSELQGTVVHGRKIAASKITWQKLSPVKTPVINTNSEAAPTYSDVIAEAAVQEELQMSLTEVINPMKWKDGVSGFSGSLATNNGVIESLQVSLPGVESLSVNFSEMSGNVFSYEMNGEELSGMMYQVDQNSYMVTLTNGPLEGTRLRFSTESAPVDQVAEAKVEVGNFGEELKLQDQQMQQEAEQAQLSNLEQAQI